MKDPLKNYGNILDKAHFAATDKGQIKYITACRSFYNDTGYLSNKQVKKLLEIAGKKRKTTSLENAFGGININVDNIIRWNVIHEADAAASYRSSRSGWDTMSDTVVVPPTISRTMRAHFPHYLTEMEIAQFLESNRPAGVTWLELASHVERNGLDAHLRARLNDMMTPQPVLSHSFDYNYRLSRAEELMPINVLGRYEPVEIAPLNHIDVNIVIDSVGGTPPSNLIDNPDIEANDAAWSTYMDEQLSVPDPGPPPTTNLMERLLEQVRTMGRRE